MSYGGPGWGGLFLSAWIIKSNAMPSTKRHHPPRLPLYTLQPTPHTLQPASYTLHATTCNPHPVPYTSHPTPYSPHPIPYSLNPDFLPPSKPFVGKGRGARPG